MNVLSVNCMVVFTQQELIEKISEYHKMFSRYTFDSRLVTRICKELKDYISRKLTKQFKKTGYSMKQCSPNICIYCITKTQKNIEICNTKLYIYFNHL